ncbi:hypothetical protein [Mycolicibacterium sp. HK-90]|uniref:hypothetical protein n=1 Tax=Mycolicibacterium sp. HK-90 TaxID=3056937 RepID=UPI002659E2ED|nr:hypothetical protein [Mycolicibacterium sp. HK-90]WKG05753.1 hypothetical protein QU592_12005 [Mycolicibacterium sp. HK-90]
MSAQMSEVRTPGVASYPIPFSRSRVRPEKALQYRLHVVAADVAGVVSGIGGWLFDRAMAGWRIAVAGGRCADGCGADCADCRALRILGLKPVEVEGLWPSGEADVIALTAISADRYGGQDLDGIRNRGAMVLFGSQAPDGLAGQVERVRYRPSAAALAFKTHALAVLGADPDSAGAETMFRYGRPAGLLDDDLVPGC